MKIGEDNKMDETSENERDTGIEDTDTDETGIEKARCKRVIAGTIDSETSYVLVYGKHEKCVGEDEIRNIKFDCTGDNVKRCRKYMRKQELTGVKVFDFDVCEYTDDVILNRYHETDDEFRTIEIPSFVTGVSSGLYTDIFSNVKQSLKVINKSKIADMSSLFACFMGKELDISEFNTTGVTSIQHMFCGCSELKSLDLSNFDTSKVDNMQGLFGGCLNIRKINLENIDTRNVRDMGNMFSKCNKLKSLDLSSFDTSNVDNMDSMFLACKELDRLDLSKFDTHNVDNMNYMFYDCSNLKTLDLNNFDTRCLRTASMMFSNCWSLNTVRLKAFDTHKLERTNLLNIFSGCRSLKVVETSDKQIIYEVQQRIIMSLEKIKITSDIDKECDKDD